MRLETESTPAAPPFNEIAEIDSIQHRNSSEAQEHLSMGIKAAQRGDRAQARVALLRSTELDPSNENAWLWLASISEYPEELLVFLNNVLDINPENSRALEWRAATNSLLAKTFVQRGIDAVDENQKEHASDYFSKALEYDQNNALAWMWMASLSESHDGQLLYLEKALSIEPENEAAQNAYRAVRREITSRHLADAKAAAVAGRTEDAKNLVEAVLEEMPDSEDAWMLRSHFADNFAEKIRSFERVLEINPQNFLASSSLESLRSLVGPTVEAPSIESAASASVEEPTIFEENDSFASAEASRFESHKIEIEKSPTQDLEMPEGAAEAFIEQSEPEMQVAAAEDLGQHHYEPEYTYDQAQEEVHEPVEAASETPSYESGASPFDQPAVDHTPVSEYSAETEYAAFDDASIEETRPNEEPKAAAHDDEQSVFPAEVPFDPSMTFYSPTPIVFEPVMEESQAEASAFVQDEDDPLPFGNTLMFTLQADELDNIPDVADARASDENIPMPMPVADGDDAEAIEPGIPMPAVEFDSTPVIEARTGFETTIAPPAPIEPQVKDCPFCNGTNDVHAISCQRCMSVLTLSDLEMLIANQNADKGLVRHAVEQMEFERNTREFGEQELTTLGIGHLNLRNLDTGFSYLQEASRANPNNVILAGQVNALHIRLEEIRKQVTLHDGMAKGKKILVVDDSPTIRKLITGKLEKSGHEVYCASDGVDAMEQLQALQPDLILLDITMPRMDGYQVCKLIRGNDATKDVPVVMISGKDGFFDKVRGRMAGTSGYITKPFGPETLMKVVEGYLNNGH